MFRKFAAKFPCTPRIVAGHVENWPQMEKIVHANAKVNSVAMMSTLKLLTSQCFNVDKQSTNVGNTRVLASIVWSYTDKGSSRLDVKTEVHHATPCAVEWRRESLLACLVV
ncbi:hypothetical protein BDR05DRAFT_1011602 [Suillus weaverae]|nr:hypothetical protein BDR05DRAFT_1011602 [Suillus weaverae]